MTNNTNELINQYQEQEKQVLEQTAYDNVDNSGEKDEKCCCYELCCDACCVYLCIGC